MATLHEALNADMSNYEALDKPTIRGIAVDNSLEPVINPMLRCPLPPISVSPDSLRQFYLGGQVPQMRLLPPPTAISGNNSGGGTVVTTTSSSSSSSSTVVTPSILATSASIVSNVINANQDFTSSLLMAKSFQLLTVTTDQAARVRLYSSATAQSNDLARALDVAPSPGVTQGLIFDVVLDTAPYTWSLQNRMGANGDAPQITSIYITITNLGLISTAITATIGYVPLES